MRCWLLCVVMLISGARPVAAWTAEVSRALGDGRYVDAVRRAKSAAESDPSARDWLATFRAWWSRQDEAATFCARAYREAVGACLDGRNRDMRNALTRFEAWAGMGQATDSPDRIEEARRVLAETAEPPPVETAPKRRTVAAVRAVPPTPTSTPQNERPAARRPDETKAEARALLRVADEARTDGHLERALRFYTQASRLDPGLKEASDGAAAVRRELN